MLVSVIIPTYNRAEYISEAIDSVLNQTYKDYEIIVVDDGSTDDTREIVNRYGNKVRYIYQENKGPSAARNNGIRNAGGDLIAFLDSDDIWLPEKLDRQVLIFKQNKNLGICASAHYMCDYELAVQNIYRINVEKHANILKSLIVKNSFCTPSVMVKKECFEKIGLFNENYRFAEDWDMWIRIALAYEIHYISEPLCKCRSLAYGITSGMDPKNLEDWRKVIQANYERTKGQHDKIISRMKSLSWYYFNVSYVYQCKWDKKNRRRYLVRSIGNWPFSPYKRYLALIRTFMTDNTYFKMKRIVKK